MGCYLDRLYLYLQPVANSFEVGEPSQSDTDMEYSYKLTMYLSTPQVGLGRKLSM